jgi:hypothetical protein
MTLILIGFPPSTPPHLQVTLLKEHQANMPVLFSNLPSEVVAKIFEYDPTFRYPYQQCCWEIHNMGTISRLRLVKELERLEAHPGVQLGVIAKVSRRIPIVYAGKQYVMTLPPSYPWEPPTVVVDGKKVPPFDFWSPSATLLTVLLVCDIEIRTGADMC